MFLSGQESISLKTGEARWYRGRVGPFVLRKPLIAMDGVVGREGFSFPGGEA